MVDTSDHHPRPAADPDAGTDAGVDVGGDGGAASTLWSNPYALAGYWADRTRWPRPDQHNPSDALRELAVMSTLADWLHRWLPIQIHYALAGGAGVEATAAAAGLAPHQLRGVWQPWADRQVDLWRTSNPHRPVGLHPGHRDQIHALLDQYGGGIDRAAGAAC